MAQILLYSIPDMDVTYQNIPWFEHQWQQDQWMNRHIKATLEGKISVDPIRTSITLAKSYAEIEQLDVDYCCLTSANNKKMYYFIVDYDYKTTGATTLILELDVIQTYMFDLEFMDSFMDRCHVDRWEEITPGVMIPTENVQDEGLQYGDKITAPLGKREGENFRPKYIISSTEPLGVNKWQKPDGGSQGGPSDCWKSGKIGADLFRMAKGFEGFGPFIYKDSGGVDTIGYGTTRDDAEAWKELVLHQPCDEKRASELAYSSFNKNYALPIKDFVIKNFKVNSQQKFDALVDLSYNAGPGRVTKGDLADILKQYPNDENKVRPVWESWMIRDEHGIIRDGLIARRKAECDMYFHGKYEKRDISILDAGGHGTGKYVTANGGNGWLPDDCVSGGPTSKNHFDAYGYDFVYPGAGTVTSVWYRSDGKTVHGALDVGCPVGTPIFATRDGVVSIAGNDPNGYGLWIEVQHKDINHCTRYAHNSELLVKTGDVVTQGQQIAKSGNTGRSSGPHYHYEFARLPYTKANRRVPIPHLNVGDVIEIE